MPWQPAKLHDDVIAFFLGSSDSILEKVVLTALETEDKETVYTAGKSPDEKGSLVLQNEWDQQNVGL